MSLNKEERFVTGQELRKNFEISNMTIEQLAQRTNLTTTKVEHILEMHLTGDIMDFIHQVWTIRNVMNEVITSNGDIPEPYSYLAEEKEEYWFLK